MNDYKVVKKVNLPFKILLELLIPTKQKLVENETN